MSVVLVPAHTRPEFLGVTLEHLMKAKRAEQYVYMFALDRGYDPQVLTTAKAFPLKKIILRPKDHPFAGGSYNILRGFAEALRVLETVGGEYINLVEDDVFVAPDYFTFHEHVQTDLRPPAVSACRNQNTSRRPDLSGPEAVYYHSSYQSLGVSVRRDVVELLVEEASDRYFANPIGYCEDHYPFSSIPIGYAEQAGLARRVFERYNFQTCYAVEPRAYHAGFYGRNRPGELLRGSLSERMRELRQMSGAEMRSRAEGYHDITPCDMEPRVFSGLIRSGFLPRALGPSSGFVNIHAPKQEKVA